MSGFRGSRTQLTLPVVTQSVAVVVGVQVVLDSIPVQVFEYVGYDDRDRLQVGQASITDSDRHLIGIIAPVIRGHFEVRCGLEDEDPRRSIKIELGLIGASS